MKARLLLITMLCFAFLGNAQVNSFPYFEGFNAGIPANWTATTNSPGAPPWFVNGGAARLIYNSNNSVSSTFRSPAFNTSNLVNPKLELSIIIGAQNYDCTPDLKIWYTTNNGASSSLVSTIGTYDLCTSTANTINLNTLSVLQISLPNQQYVQFELKGYFYGHPGNIIVNHVSFYADNAVAVSAINTNSVLSFGPNPCKDQITIHDASPRSTYVLSNMKGISVQSGSVPHDGAINTTGLRPGTYILSLKNAKEATVGSSKIIKL